MQELVLKQILKQSSSSSVLEIGRKINIQRIDKIDKLELRERDNMASQR